MSERSSDTCMLKIYPVIVTEEILKIVQMIRYLSEMA